MLIVIAVLMAFILVALLVMITSVYQMDRDFRKKLTDLRRDLVNLQHKMDYFESEHKKTVREADNGNNRPGTDNT